MPFKGEPTPSVPFDDVLRKLEKEDPDLTQAAKRLYEYFSGNDIVIGHSLLEDYKRVLKFVKSKALDILSSREQEYLKEVLSTTSWELSVAIAIQKETALHSQEP